MTQVPVVLADEWTPAQVKAFRLAVNRSAEWAEWDDELLKLKLDDLKLEDFDLDLIGFDAELEEAETTSKEQEYSEKLTIVVECASESEQEQLFQEFQDRGLKCRIQSL